MTSETRQIVTSIDLRVSCERCFQTLITPSEITQWWHCSAAIVIPKLDGAWVARWGDTDEPDYVVSATIVQFEPGKVLKLANFKYFSKSGSLQFETDLPVRALLVDLTTGEIRETLENKIPSWSRSQPGNPAGYFATHEGAPLVRRDDGSFVHLVETGY